MGSNFYYKLENAWSISNSMVCVGLDSDINKIPEFLKASEDPIFQFNKSIIDATAKEVCSFKLQIAFYSSISAEQQLIETIQYIKENYPDVIVILDSKRGDIGNTAEQYALESFTRYKADAVTLNPYLGGDSLQPFLNYSDKGSIILCRTSNPGAKDLQDLICDEEKLYIKVAKLASTQWNANKNISLVIGATYPKELKEIRQVVGDNIPFLVPGIGAQGGDLENTVKNGKNSNGTGLMISSSRGIIFASSGSDFAEAAKKETIKLKEEINYYACR
jgi:orotidine-5'-phosphate decarboxylase